MSDTPSPAPSPASQSSAANGEALPAWPTEADYISIEPPDGHEAGRDDYYYALAAAWEARARLAVEALGYIRDCYAVDDASVRAQRALAAIGPLPPSPKEPKEQRT